MSLMGSESISGEIGQEYECEHLGVYTQGLVEVPLFDAHQKLLTLRCSLAVQIDSDC